MWRHARDRSIACTRDTTQWFRRYIRSKGRFCVALRGSQIAASIEECQWTHFITCVYHKNVNHSFCLMLYPNCWDYGASLGMLISGVLHGFTWRCDLNFGNWSGSPGFSGTLKIAMSHYSPTAEECVGVLVIFRYRSNICLLCKGSGRQLAGLLLVDTW